MSEEREIHVLVCQCGNYQHFDPAAEDPTTSTGCCSGCGSKEWQMYPADEYSVSEHWKMVCLARYLLKTFDFKSMGYWLSKYENRNGAAAGEKLREFLRIEYEKAGGTKKRRPTQQAQTSGAQKALL